MSIRSSNSYQVEDALGSHCLVSLQSSDPKQNGLCCCKATQLLLFAFQLW